MADFYRCAARGFSLVELLVALTLFTIGLLAVASMQITAIRGNSSANSLTIADGLAAGVLEELLSYPDHHPLFTTDIDDRLWWFDGNQTVAGAGSFTARFSIDADYAEPKLTRVQVKVTQVGKPTTKATTLVGFRRRK